MTLTLTLTTFSSSRTSFRSLKINISHINPFYPSEIAVLSQETVLFQERAVLSKESVLAQESAEESATRDHKTALLSQENAASVLFVELLK